MQSCIPKHAKILSFIGTGLMSLQRTAQNTMHARCIAMHPFKSNQYNFSVSPASQNNPA